MAGKRPAERKKGTTITGIPCDSENKLTVQKSTPLYGLWRSELSLADFKILDTYLSRINSHDPNHRTVHFEKGEIEQMLGVKKINAADLKKRLAHLGTMVPVDDPTKKERFRMVSLFAEAICETDDDGVWQIDLTCTSEARKYIFNIENLGYFRYKLRTVTRLRSRYSYILFLYLEKNRHMHSTWDVALDELKLLLKCEDDALYQEYRYFNQRILKRCHKELTENTECQFTYEPIKHGRTVKAIRFTLATVANRLGEQLDGQLVLADMAPDFPAGYGTRAGAYDAELCEFLAEACDFEFNKQEIRVLLDLILQLIPAGQHREMFDYLRHKYNLLKLYAVKRNISNRFSYIKTIIEKDLDI